MALEENNKHHSILTALHSIKPVKDLNSLKQKTIEDDLEKNLELDNYLAWTALNRVIRNGDFVDEVYFYSHKEPSGEIRFDIFPWDLDDGFSDAMHFGFANSLRKDEASEKLMNGFESQLDQTIAGNPLLLKRYFGVAESLLTEKLNQETIDQVFLQIKSELEPYLERPTVLSAMLRDRVATHPADVKLTISRMMLADRLAQPGGLREINRTHVLNLVTSLQAALNENRQEMLGRLHDLKKIDTNTLIEQNSLVLIMRNILGDLTTSILREVTK